MVPNGQQPSEAVVGLRLEAGVALRQPDPGLRAADPKVRSRAQPGGVVQRARPHPDEGARRRRARLSAVTDPSPALWADPPRHRASTVGRTLEWPYLASCEAARLGLNYDRQGEGAAGQPLADGAVASVGDQRRLGDLVAHRAAQAAAGLRGLHRNAFATTITVMAQPPP